MSRTPATAKAAYGGWIPFLFLAFALCLLQALLMSLGATALLLYEPAATFVRDHLGFLQDYIPMFTRYAAIFAAKGRAADFLPFVSVYLFFFALQGLILVGLAACFALSIARRGNMRSESLGFWKTVILLAMICFFALPLADLFFGLSNIENPGVFENGLLYRDYFTAVYSLCLTVPVSNAGLFFLAWAPFFEPDMTRRAELEPVKNPDRVWTVDQFGKDIE